jgi:hypothetical protein
MDCSCHRTGLCWLAIGTGLRPEDQDNRPRQMPIQDCHILRSEFPTREALQSSVELNFTNDPAKLNAADFIIVTLPTPVAEAPPEFRPAGVRQRNGERAHEARRHGL